MLQNTSFSFRYTQRLIHSTLLCFVLITIVCLGAMPATAQVSTWLNNGGGFYETPENWNTLQVPPPDHSVSFGFPGNYSVEFQSDHTSAGLLVTLDSEPIFIAGDSSTNLTYTMNGDIDIHEEASLTLEGGPGPGSFHLDSEDYVTTVDGWEININPGLKIHDNARLSSLFGHVGFAPGTFGRAHLTGDDSSWVVDSRLIVGGEGSAELTVESGASITSSRGTIADEASSSSIVNINGVGTDGMPSTWSTTATITSFKIGPAGYGELNISDGAFVSNNKGVELAGAPGATAEVSVSGVDANGNPSTWSTGDMMTSLFGGMSFLTIEDGGLVKTDHVDIGGHGPANVELIGSDNAGNPSEWIVAEHLSVGSDALGKIRVKDGAKLSTQSADIGGNGSTLTLDSGVSGIHSSWFNSGDVNVGTIGGNNVNPSLFLEDESQVDIGGTLTLAGNGWLFVENSFLVADRIDHTHGGGIDPG